MWLKMAKQLNNLHHNGFKYTNYYTMGGWKYEITNIKISNNKKKHKLCTKYPDLTWPKYLDSKYDRLFNLYLMCKIYAVPMDILQYHLYPLC